MKEFAVIKTGGKQYVVSKGSSIKIEKLSDTAKVGDTVAFEHVLLVDNGTDATIGMPYIKGAKVEGTIERIGHLPKVTVIHYKQKSRYFKKAGHKQPFVQVKIENIK